MKTNVWIVTEYIYKKKNGIYILCNENGTRLYYYYPREWNEKKKKILNSYEMKRKLEYQFSLRTKNKRRTINKNRKKKKKKKKKLKIKYTNTIIYIFFGKVKISNQIFTI